MRFKPHDRDLRLNDKLTEASAFTRQHNKASDIISNITQTSEAHPAIHCRHSRFKHIADKETVDLPRSIPTPNDEQLELLTQLRLRATARSYLRRMVFREAAHQMGYLEGMIDDNASSDILVLRTLEHIMANLLHRLIAVREEEEADAALERYLWGQV